MPPAEPPARPPWSGTPSAILKCGPNAPARSLAAAGATANDIVQVSYGYGLFTGGLGAHYGAERLGATVIPMSGGSTKRQVQLMRDFGATVLCCTPSYACISMTRASKSG